ncbi:MAG TPA: hypothetical protein DCM43_00715 [Lachnospiraceae bacterium]|nr:hypothetical protein [Lachnospiraceae bacterium]
MAAENTMHRMLPELPKRNPINGTFELTVRCNLHCKMCLFRHDDRENPELMAKELTAAQWIDMAGQAAKAGTLSLLITGGEPMLRPDFCEIWEGIYRLGFVTELYTNATLMSPKIMETLRKYPPHQIGITIYGVSPETYGKVCGNEIAFHQMLDGVRQLQTLPSELSFRTTLIQENFQDAQKIDDMVSREFGIQYKVKQASPINKAVRGACAKVELHRVPPEQDCAMKANRMMESIRKFVGDAFDPRKLVIKQTNSMTRKEDDSQRYSLFGCKAGMAQYTITYDGKLLACQMIGAFSTDARKDGLQAAWDAYPFSVHIPETEVKCDKCTYRDTCQACYGTRYAETGDFNGCSDYMYQYAKAKKQYGNFTGGNQDEQCKI